MVIDDSDSTWGTTTTFHTYPNQTSHLDSVAAVNVVPAGVVALDHPGSGSWKNITYSNVPSRARTSAMLASA
ncbi:MAG: hypothetical protein M3451_09705 [Chloroflexota bacterium]|nr:hypothetical protein [Chloroflexota bacterium]